MPTIGQDCELILDAIGYFAKPGSYQMTQPRIRKATVRADGGEAYVDLGPGKRVWSLIILCLNDLQRYDGSSTGMNGQQYRDALRNSYLNSTASTVQFLDPLNTTPIAVHIDRYSERVYDLHIQQVSPSISATTSLSYEVSLELIEA